jgi:hypothetical protein
MATRKLHPNRWSSALSIGFAAIFVGFAAFAASAPVDPEMTAAAKKIQAGCVARGEDARVCACGVGLGYAQLDPKTFKLIPDVEPLLDEKDKFKALSGLAAAAGKRGVSTSELMTAYNTIRANRTASRAVCKPLASVPATAKN